jgi:hypothetical protein
LHAHVPTEDKSDVSKERFCEGTELGFCQFPKCSVKILMEYFNPKLGKKGISKPTRGSEILYEQAIIIMPFKYAI